MNLVSDTKSRGNVKLNTAVLDGIILKTTGASSGLPINGVITQTSRGAKGSTAAVEKYHGNKVRTQPMTYGQVPYAGPKF